MIENKVPKFEALMSSSVQALKRLGGSESIDEMLPEIFFRVDGNPMTPPENKGYRYRLKQLW